MGRAIIQPFAVVNPASHQVLLCFNNH